MVAPLVLIGALGSLAAIASFVSPKRRATSGPLRTWAGFAGPIAIAVTRNGAGWAWYTEDTRPEGGAPSGSGSAATAKLALQNAFRTAIESGHVPPGDTLSVRSASGDVVGFVRQAGSGFVSDAAGQDGWGFQVVPPQGDTVTVVGIATRGAAALQLLDTIEPFTDGSA